jgi:hypothetical protein
MLPGRYAALFVAFTDDFAAATQPRSGARTRLRSGVFNAEHCMSVESKYMPLAASQGIMFVGYASA